MEETSQVQTKIMYLPGLFVVSIYLEEALSFNILKWTREKRIFCNQYIFIPIVQ
jgi:hypothetical protein